MKSSDEHLLIVEWQSAKCKLALSSLNFVGTSLAGVAESRSVFFKVHLACLHVQYLSSPINEFPAFCLLTGSLVHTGLDETKDPQVRRYTRLTYNTENTSDSASSTIPRDTAPTVSEGLQPSADSVPSNGSDN